MGQKIAGTCYVKVDGAQLTIKGGCEAALMEVKRTTLVPGYFKEEERKPSLKVTALHTPDFPLKQLVNGTDMTITCELSNGKVYVLAGAYLVGEPVSKGDEGEIALEFDGIKGAWQ
ncbi:phage tail tube protein [Pseudomonas fontis]|uniref:Phage tail tube protein n=1 Tax=Pseudomonas fontis TaxID=2942633 RepID=A0ABT5NPM3_9PSED|nr:phage tail tube protein [Pseudomonas fontis]MDD0972437.1 phage tail tube protein [Pseudomonas fontis]MDD0990106.1 phage tail tube protein [Pseudomonas fontis]